MRYPITSFLPINLGLTICPCARNPDNTNDSGAVGLHCKVWLILENARVLVCEFANEFRLLVTCFSRNTCINSCVAISVWLRASAWGALKNWPLANLWECCKLLMNRCWRQGENHPAIPSYEIEPADVVLWSGTCIWQMVKLENAPQSAQNGQCACRLPDTTGSLHTLSVVTCQRSV